MSPPQFTTTTQQLQNKTNNTIQATITTTTQTKNGDITTVAHTENITTNNQIQTNKINIQLKDNTETIYARAIIYIITDTIALLDWIEIVDPTHRNHGIGSTFISEIIQYIDQKTSTKRTYTKVENPHLQSPLINEGFKQTNKISKDTWYIRD